MPIMKPSCLWLMIVKCISRSGQHTFIDSLVDSWEIFTPKENILKILSLEKVSRHDFLMKTEMDYGLWYKQEIFCFSYGDEREKALLINFNQGAKLPFITFMILS